MKLLNLGAVTSEGGLLPIDLLSRVYAGDRSLPGLEPTDYYLLPAERLNEAAERAWSRLTVLWRGLQAELAGLPAGNHATGTTQKTWLLPLFDVLGYGRLEVGRPHQHEGKTLAVSHQRGAVPIHLVGWNVSLDRKGTEPGVQISPPHALLQELLNREEAYLWGFVSNGRELRVLRDHHSLTRQAYVSFDLEAILEEERFSEFYLLWLVCHQSRSEAAVPEESILEQWFKCAREQGINALGKLRRGVTRAIEALGAGFLAHRDNSALHEALHSGQLTKQDYYRMLLRLIYRLIFLFVAEERELLLDPNAAETARQRYRDHYALGRLRPVARARRGGNHGDLWHCLRLVMSQLAEGCPALALPALGSRLWEPEFIGILTTCELANRDLLSALRRLAFTQEGRQTYPVNWRAVGADELGGIYEALLELHPEIERESARFELVSAAGNERKTSGSYYTPPELVDQLLDTALDPVLDEAVQTSEPERAILNMTVCDPSCGSGHFLVAAAHRMAKRLAAVRTGDSEPAPGPLRTALRDVIGHCIHGVDLNPMTVELCKLSLWLEALEPGKPLSFLDHHILVGNSLLGTTPALMALGIPEKVFSPIGDDDKKTARGLAKDHRAQRKTEHQEELFGLFTGQGRAQLQPIIQLGQGIQSLDDTTLDAVRTKEKAFRALLSSPDYRRACFEADLWCAAMVWPKPPPNEVDSAYLSAVPTEGNWKQFRADPTSVPQQTRTTTACLAEEYRFFHWHLAFPHVFGEIDPDDKQSVTGWKGGFDVILGNPPWERIKLQEKEWFAQRRPEIAAAVNAAARKRAIAALAEDEAGQRLFAEWRVDSRVAEGTSFLIRTSGRYPLCARGDINTYAIFSELDRTCLAPRGRMGVVVPGGIAMDATTQFFFRDLVEKQCLHSLYHFENSEKIFVGVHSSYCFCALTVHGIDIQTHSPRFISYARRVSQLRDEHRAYTLSSQDFQRMNPNTRTLPAFRWSRDARINRAIYERVPVLWDENKEGGNAWNITFLRMFDMANDSGLFRDANSLQNEGWVLDGNRYVRGEEVMLPLYEAKMVHHFNDRFGSYEGQTEAQANQGRLPESSAEQLADPEFRVQPRYWVESSDVEKKLEGRWEHEWLFGWRDICRSSDYRTAVATVFPKSAAGGTIFLALLAKASMASMLSANFVCLVFDYAVRQKIGGTHLSQNYIKQIPLLHPKLFRFLCLWDLKLTYKGWINLRALELIYTSWDLQPFAQDHGYEGPPFRYDETRRELIRAELDAAFFHLYGIERDDVAYIMDTFEGVAKKDNKAHGEFRTKRLILERFDALAEASASGRPYVTPLDPPPGDPRVAHPARTHS